MSDIAPFVAAILKDKAVADLQEENDSLKKQLEEANRVVLSGTDGTVYAEGNMTESDTDSKIFPKLNTQHHPLKLKNTSKCSIHDLLDGVFFTQHNFRAFAKFSEFFLPNTFDGTPGELIEGKTAQIGFKFYAKCSLIPICTIIGLVEIRQSEFARMKALQQSRDEGLLLQTVLGTTRELVKYTKDSNTPVELKYIIFPRPPTLFRRDPSDEWQMFWVKGSGR